MSEIVDIADYLDLEDLIHAGLERIRGAVSRSYGHHTEVLNDILRLPGPMQQRLLDGPDSAVFDALCGLIPPYDHQYKNILRQVLHGNRFAQSVSNDDCCSVYESIREVQSNLHAIVEHGAVEIQEMAKIDKSLFSPDYCSLACLDQGSQRLTVWDLRTSPLQVVDLYHGVIDFAFSPQGTLVVLRWDGGVTVYRRSKEVYSLKYGGHNDGLAVSECCALMFSTLLPWVREQLDSVASARLWNWTSPRALQDVPALESSTCACLSSDGTLLAYCKNGHEIRTRSTVYGEPDSDRELTKARKADRWEDGDVLALVMSEDRRILVALYVKVIRVWDIASGTEPVEYRLEISAWETVRHVVPASDGSLLALASWEGSITLLSRTSVALVNVGTLTVDSSILHLDWSPDRQFFVVSSYRGSTLVRAAF